MRLLLKARGAGYTGSDRNFRRLVVEAKSFWRSTVTEVDAQQCGNRVSI